MCEIHRNKKLKQKRFSIAKITDGSEVSKNTIYKDVGKSPEKLDEWVLYFDPRGKMLYTYEEIIVNSLRETPNLSGAQIHDG